MSLIRNIYRSIPAPLRTMLSPWIARIPWTSPYKHRKWVIQEYTKFGDDQRHFLFMSIARFCHINRPIPGYYFEFGCHGANTMKTAYDISKHLFDWTYVGFDSFEGLPEIEEIDKQAIWEKGKLKTTEEEFRKSVIGHGVPEGKLLTIKGFYEQTLTDPLKAKLLPQKAAVIYIDCDLYTSTVPVLRFIKDFLQRGTIIVFDDWNCFCGDPEKGERRAFQEFRDQHPDLQFEEFVQTDIAKAFIFVGGPR